jgi:hypothetical protein
MINTRLTVLTTLIGSTLLLPLTPADAAVSVSKFELTNGNLRIEGNRAVANSRVTISSSVSLASGRADKSGKWKIQATNFQTPDCTVSINDGTAAVNRTVTGCTPSAPPPPDPVNLTPTANAGPDQTIIDTDGDGFAILTLTGAASSDPDGSIIGYIWSDQGATGTSLGSGSNLSIARAIGTYAIVLTVTDNAGAQSSDVVNITVAAAPAPAPIPAPAPQGTILGVLESNQVWSGSFDSALMGASVASAGDVNGDGYDDVIVGALGFDAPGGLFDEGAVFVFLGGPDGIIGNSPDTANAAIIGNEAASEFGTSVSGAGDINGDGFDDIIVGAPLVNSSGISTSGAAYIFLGSPTGITATSPADANFVLDSKQITSWFGHDVASAGDVNGDGFDDVIIGAPRYGQPFNPPIPNQGSGQQGAAFVFLGSASGIVGTDPQTAHATIVPVSPGAPSQTRAFFGWSVDTAGDVNSDGYADIIIGAPNWNVDRPWPGTGTGEPPSEGTAFIYLGSPLGITGTNPTNAAARIDGDLLDAAMGVSVAGVGDVNADGFDDVLIGAPGYPAGDPLLGSAEGGVFLFYGGASGINATSATQAQWSSLGTIAVENLGRAVAGVGDVNGDGIADVAVSARTFTGAIADDAAYNGSPLINGEGIVYVYNGSPTGLVDTAITVRSGQESGAAGYSVGGPADVNGDGLYDLIVGVPGYTNNQAREGAAFVHISDGASPILPSANSAL